MANEEPPIRARRGDCNRRRTANSTVIHGTATATLNVRTAIGSNRRAFVNVQRRTAYTGRNNAKAPVRTAGLGAASEKRCAPYPNRKNGSKRIAPLMEKKSRAVGS